MILQHFSLIKFEIIFCFWSFFYIVLISQNIFLNFSFYLRARDVKSNMISMCYDLKSETIFSDFLLWKKVQVNCLDYGLTLGRFENFFFAIIVIMGFKRH